MIFVENWVKRLQRKLRRADVASPVRRVPSLKTDLPDILQWARQFDVDQRPWLVLGKGPSYSTLDRYDLSGFWTCSLNHVVRQHPVDLAHMIDIDVVDACQEAIDQHARYLVLPYFPHVDHDPTNQTLDDFVRKMPVLKALSEQGRLIGYNLSSTKRQVEGSPTIVAKFFSAEAAIHLLAACGAKTIRSLGVDGGRAYATQYQDLNGKTLLANGHQTFDGQFQQIAATIRRYQIFYAPLYKDAPIKVFVGADASQTLAGKVLDYSIQKHASLSVTFVPLSDVPVPLPRDSRNRPRTGFSFARFLIPRLCGYQGRAIYLDADMLVFDDLAHLWELPMEDADLLCAEQPSTSGRARQYSVLVLNCASLRWSIEEIVNGLDEGRYDYRQLMYECCVMPPDRVASAIPSEWNSLESYEPGRTRLIHYTDMPTQPWVSHKNRYGYLWEETLREAVDEGFISLADLYEEITRGHVIPDLPQRLGLPAHPQYTRLARSFVPPYKRFSKR